jgi:hypothetical protein
MGKTVICTCPECIEHRVIVDDQQISGRKVTQQRRRLHEIAAAANRSPYYAKAHKSHPVGIEEHVDDEEDGRDKAGSSAGAQHLCG